MNQKLVVSFLHCVIFMTTGRIPWTDLRYFVGEILYGDHIVNENDRLVCATYLNYFLRDELFEEMNLVVYPTEETSLSSSSSSSSSGQNRDGSSDNSGTSTSSSSTSVGGGAYKKDFFASKVSFGYEKINATLGVYTCK